MGRKDHVCAAARGEQEEEGVKKKKQADGVNNTKNRVK